MPRRTDIRKILIIGSGPIRIGQACEFDYSGTQALKTLMEEGFETVLLNSNPATIMTDPEMATRTYIEPLTVETAEKIIEKEKVDALLPTVGGQTALNLTLALAEKGILKQHHVKLIGADIEAIQKAEDRQKFKDCMTSIGLNVPKGKTIRSVEEGLKTVKEWGLPVVIRPAYTMGGSGGGIVTEMEELIPMLQWGLDQSPIRQILLEVSVAGWKEYELEVMRDKKDNVVIICSIENIDPMGVHTGDSITVAPAQTLTDKEYQQMRNAAMAAVRAIGVETGGCNVQFAVHPKSGERVIIEINPRVSRSSALASKATGFPIAKIAAKLACGYTLDEIPNDITKKTPASFEPTLDYVVTKIPRFTFEKFPTTPDILTTQMKSVGEVMAIGRNFKESLLKAIRSLELDRYGLTSIFKDTDRPLELGMLKNASADRLWLIGALMEKGHTPEEVHAVTHIDPWFLRHIQEIVQEEMHLKKTKNLSSEEVERLKKIGFSDLHMSRLTGISEPKIRAMQKKGPAFLTVDTCGAEFEAFTPYLYSSYDGEDEFPASQKKKVLILGSGPNRIGQGLEFDYCCVHAAMSLREMGIETLMLNCNPETVSTDYDTSDRLYFEPLVLENVLHVIEKEKPFGVMVQFGGQTPLKLCNALYKAGVPILGTTPASIDLAEDRDQFCKLNEKIGIRQPAYICAQNVEEALVQAKKIGFPVLARPSYVLGGRGMQIVYDQAGLENYLKYVFTVSPGHPVLIDRFLQDAMEIDVDAVSDGEEVQIAGIMEHVEEAGIHSGDSSCVLPPYTLSQKKIEEISEATKKLAKALGVVGCLNVQFAIQNNILYVLEANPRASRTIPFVSKATGVSWAKIATQLIMGKKLKDLSIQINHRGLFSVKSPVFPFEKFPGVDILLRPEMSSTGEVMGQARDFPTAFAKAQIGAGQALPLPPGVIFMSVHDGDKPKALEIATELKRMGYPIVATSGTAAFLQEGGVEAEKIQKLSEGSTHIIEALRMKKIAMIINTTINNKTGATDSFSIRRTALELGIPNYTNMRAAWEACEALGAIIQQKHSHLVALQD